jgi:hypothetical protein
MFCLDNFGISCTIQLGFSAHLNFEHNPGLVSRVWIGWLTGLVSIAQMSVIALASLDDCTLS